MENKEGQLQGRSHTVQQSPWGSEQSYSVWEVFQP